MLDPVRNLVKCQVSQGYDDAATSIDLESGDGAQLPDPSTDGEFNLVWFNASDYPDPTDDPNVEIVRVTARSTDTLTVTRAQESTSASTKNEAGKTYLMVLGITKKMRDDIQARLNDGEFETAVFIGEVDNGNSGTSDTIDWTAGNKQKTTVTGDVTYAFTAPSGPCNLILKIVNGGSQTITWPGSVLWAGGSEPEWTASGTDIASFYYDGTSYYGQAALDFS